MIHVAARVLCHIVIILCNSALINTFAECPLNCEIQHNCTEPDSGCSKCEPAYWGRQCEYRTECQINKKENYQGLQNFTIDGIPCQAWSSQTPHMHNVIDTSLTENYCRMVASYDERPFPWCFTTDPAIEWRYCGIKLCDFQCPIPSLESHEFVDNPPINGFEVGQQIRISNGSGSSYYKCMPDLSWSNLTHSDLNQGNNNTDGASNDCPSHCSDEQCTDPDRGCSKCVSAYWGRQCQHRSECLLNSNGISYRGLRNTTRMGMPCQHWSEQTPHQHPFSGSELTQNHCRNPSGRTFHQYYPWCYTTDPNIPWDYCGINYCYLQCLPPSLHNMDDVLNPSPYGFYVGYVISLYHGTTSEITNHTCTPELCWSSLTCKGNCPKYCNKKYCNDPDGGCQKCKSPYWGRQCQHRTECKRDYVGITYRGLQNVTENGTECLQWSSRNIPGHFMNGVELTENHCRNPDNNENPWCYVSGSPNLTGFCDIERCNKQCLPPTLVPYADVLNPAPEGFRIGYQIELQIGDIITRHNCTIDRCWSGLSCEKSTTVPEIISTTPSMTTNPNVSDCCVCMTPYWNNSQTGRIDGETIKQGLALSKITLSAYIRQKTCAEDDRLSAARIGYVGIVILIIVIMSPVICDIISFTRSSKQHKCRRKIIKT